MRRLVSPRLLVVPFVAVLSATWLSVGPSTIAGALSPLTLSVNSKADTHAVNPKAGACHDAKGHCTLRAAIEVANAQVAGRLVTVHVPVGTYKLTLGSLLVKHNAVVVNGAKASTTIVTGQSKSQVLSVHAKAVLTLNQIELRGGNAATAGGGIANYGTTTLVSSIVTANTAATGGGISNAAGSTLTLDNSTVSSNTVASVADSIPGGDAGGISNAGTLVLNGSTISANDAGQGGFGGSDTGGPGGNGGGIANTGTVTVTATTITANQAGVGGIGLSGQEVSGQGGNGGGIYSRSGSVTLTNSTISNNSSGPAGPLGEGSANAGDGGGVWSAATLAITGTTFSGNLGGQGPAGSGGNGGGIFTSGSATVTSSTFTSNTGGTGGSIGGAGGAIDSAGTLTLSTSTLSGNTAGAGEGGGYGGNGGGLAVTGGTSILSGDTLNGNMSGTGGNAIPVDPGCARPGPGGDGGGIYSVGSLSVTNSTLTGNTTGQGGFYVPPCAGQAPTGVGGGLSTAGGSAGLSYVTIADNSDGITNLAGTDTLGGAIVADNTGANCTGTTSESSGYNLDSGTTCGFTALTDETGTEPGLGSLANNGGSTQTMALSAGSPAIDAGGTSATGCPTTDQRGQARPDEPADLGACDIGAYESQGVG